MTTAENIKAARKNRGLTQKALGDLCGIAEPTIRKYESGRLNPKLETLQKLAAALGYSAYDLLSIEQTSMLLTTELFDIETTSTVEEAKQLALVRGLEREAFLCNLDFIFNDTQEFFDCLKDFSDLTRDEAMQIWDFTKWVKSKRTKDGDTNAKPQE